MFPFNFLYFQGCPVFLPFADRSLQGCHSSPAGPVRVQPIGSNDEHCPWYGNIGPSHLAGYPRGNLGHRSRYTIRRPAARTAEWICRPVGDRKLHRVHDLLSGLFVADFGPVAKRRQPDPEEQEGKPLGAGTDRRGSEAESGGATGKAHHVQRADDRARPQPAGDFGEGFRYGRADHCVALARTFGSDEQDRTERDLRVYYEVGSLFLLIPVYFYVQL